MYLSKKQINQLIKIMEMTQQILTDASKMPPPSESRSASGRTRRVGKDLVAFKKTVKAERKAGVPVAELARKYHVTPSYIYQILKIGRCVALRAGQNFRRLSGGARLPRRLRCWHRDMHSR